uniref:Uncharacterized protein n=2 Tax=Helicotheca tamesis TaxID=374047 RepID=A0A7S2HQR8_9STRA|mmetsp:Transcript_20327/g.27844  ORF Transcript_20327/g.27844 Transcript_20327/m.27844 type:complete len:284 (+) Transcript_20327:156-1007(+)
MTYGTKYTILLKRPPSKKRKKKQLDQIIAKKKEGWGNITLGFGKKNKVKKPEKSGEELKKEAYDEDTGKGWTIVANETNKWESKGVFARKMVNVYTDQVFGLEFECDVSKLQSDKVVLRYDFRRKTWTLPKKAVPKELDSLGMDLSSWSRIWDMTQSALKKTQMHEKEKKRIATRMENRNLNLVIRGKFGDELEIKKYCNFMTGLLEQKMKCDKDSDKAWKIIESKVRDICLPLGVMSSLLVHDTESYGGGGSFMYSGLELRVIPSNGGEVEQDQGPLGGDSQ